MTSSSHQNDRPRDRKAEHIQLALEEKNQLRMSFLDRYTFEHVALPEIDAKAIDTSALFLGKRISAPLLISCMTGGTGRAAEINRNLALAAEEKGIALGVGSQRKALEDESQVASFQIREQAPTVPLLANLGAVQLNYGFGLEECEAAVAMIQADALVLHLNPLQEAIQPEGQCDFSGLLDKIGSIARDLSVPLIVKEVGCGISGHVARRLAEHGVAFIDTAGLGGTSWSRIEGQRADDPSLGDLFAHWGIPTPDSIRQVRDIPGMTVIASGGLRNGLDVAKSIALGAHLAGMAYPFLAPATESHAAVGRRIDRIVDELRIAMFCLGTTSLHELGEQELRIRSMP